MGEPLRVAGKRFDGALAGEGEEDRGGEKQDGDAGHIELRGAEERGDARQPGDADEGAE